jgi:hypothetical protein
LEKIKISDKLPAKVHEVWDSNIEQGEGNYHISYSQLSVFHTCKKRWYMEYIEKKAPYRASIFAMFGTAMHETIQHWLTVMYHKGVKKSKEIHLKKSLKENMIAQYAIEREKNEGIHFSSPEELNIFFLNGVSILEFLEKNRLKYYSTRHLTLSGIETLLYVELFPGVYFKGFIDMIIYDYEEDLWYLIDLKTSTRGWGYYAKSDDLKISQLRLYKLFFSKQFDIPLNKIKTEYHILKRQVPVDTDFPAMQRRVQVFKPTSGTNKVKQAYTYVEDFIKEVFDDKGNVINKDYRPSPSKSACKFCPFLNSEHCSLGVF